MGLIVSFLAGLIVGIISVCLIFKFALRSAAKEVYKADRERERLDPANWWKYGGDPFDTSVYDTNEEDGIA